MDITFNGFIFPVVSDMEYMVDGPDKNDPDRLFVTNCNKAFQFYFEKGFIRLPNLVDSNEYKKIEIQEESAKYKLCYPNPEKNNGKRTCYFSIKFDKKDVQCCGQLLLWEYDSIHEAFKKSPQVYDFIRKIKLFDTKEGKYR